MEELLNVDINDDSMHGNDEGQPSSNKFSSLDNSRLTPQEGTTARDTIYGTDGSVFFN